MINNSAHYYLTILIGAILTSLILFSNNTVMAQSLMSKKDSLLKTPRRPDTSLKIDKAKQKSDTLEWVNSRMYPKKGMMSKYKLLFNTLHGAQQKIDFSETAKYSEILYDSINGLYYGKLSNTNTLVPEARVMGWHPYWMKDACKYYPYSLLTTIAFFAYDINENDGSSYDQDAIKNWHSTSLIDSAKKNKVNVLLTVTSYGEKRNDVFLQNKTAWAILGDSLRILLQARNAQGIDIDLAGISAKRRVDLVQFVKTLRTKLGDTCTISFHITSKDLKNGSLDLKGLKSQVNVFVVQGYDYEYTSLNKGPLAPLYSKKKEGTCIVNTIEVCLNNGLDAKEIILNLPLYGALWEKSEPMELSYDDIVSIYQKNYRHTIDFWSESAFITNIDGKKDTLFYESSESLQRKFRWAKEHGLNGVGLWGLGYDGGHPEVWQAVVNNFGVAPTQQISPFALNNGQIYPFVYALQKYRKQIGIGIFIMAIFFISGLLFSLLDWRVREIFFRNYINRALLSSIILLLLIVSLYCFSTGTFTRSSIILPLASGLVLGGGIVYLTTKLYMNYRKKMP